MLSYFAHIGVSRCLVVIPNAFSNSGVFKSKSTFNTPCRNLADVDKDGKLKAEEFILAMHLVDMAKSGQAMPLILPPELVPPSQR